MKEKIAVIGGGAFGTALATLAAEGNRTVEVYAREDQVVSSINEIHENTMYLKGVKLNSAVKAKHMDDLENCDAKNFIWTVPTQFTRTVARQYKDFFKGKNILNCSKGIEIETGKLVLEIIEEEVDADFSMLSGPSFANEVANKKLTAVSLASLKPELAAWWQKELSCNYLRIYTSTDVIGLEVGGALKNVMAVATGISDGMNFDNNSRAALITRGLAEIAGFGVARGAKRETFYGLSGLGDLVLTAIGDKSRNRKVGMLLAEGFKINEITEKFNSVSEGVFTAKAVYIASAKMGIEMPICTEVYKIIYEDKKVHESARDLMSRPLKSEK